MNLLSRVRERQTGRERLPVVWTIGHSTRDAAEFRDVLGTYRIELVIDVRRFPGSRRLPQFAAGALEHDLERHGISYRWISSLGGRRRGSRDSVNQAWRHASFRAYADHLATEEFAGGLAELMMLANGLRTVIMCAEVLWWRCHRRLIADVLVSVGIPTIHIRDSRVAEEHRLGPPARLVGGVLSYSTRDG
jgi:uncharacterized protein (DUF488 family)